MAFRSGDNLFPSERRKSGSRRPEARPVAGSGRKPSVSLDEAHRRGVFAAREHAKSPKATGSAGVWPARAAKPAPEPATFAQIRAAAAANPNEAAELKKLEAARRSAIARMGAPRGPGLFSMVNPFELFASMSRRPVSAIGSRASIAPGLSIPTESLARRQGFTDLRNVVIEPSTGRASIQLDL